ncbi:MAG: CRISPR system precrRNA processing endoribonuclease RAMP protein Cas6 [ANME-2 cluster archaeon]|nr:CRISPR system precrRNA processing endoribonuclease RAMP protein Cas6 [ANME-2 cluster archaeon]
MCIEKRKECVQCVHRYKCIYSYVFETPIPREAKEGKRSKDEYVPHPFVIEPTLDKRQYYGIEDELDFHIILVGRAVDYIPYIIFAFEELGRIGIGKDKGKYSLEKVISINNNRELLIYDGNSHIQDDFYVMDSTELVRQAAQLNYQQVTFYFLTPTRIKNKGKLTIDIDFVIILRNLLRRLSRLAEVHCDEKWELEWNELIEMANDRVSTVSSELKWYDWKRYSQRQGTKMKMGGFLGEITFEGELAEFMPFIKLGELLHMGKGTVYGLGKYEIKGE